MEAVSVDARSRLICAGWVPHDREFAGVFRVSRGRPSHRPLWRVLLMADSRVAPRAACTVPVSRRRLVGWSVHDRQTPAPAGELAGHGYSADGGAFTAAVKPAPAAVQPPVADLGTSAHGGRLAVLAAEQFPAQSIAFAVLPGGLDQRPAGVGVAGLGDRTLAATLAA